MKKIIAGVFLLSGCAFAQNNNSLLTYINESSYDAQNNLTYMSIKPSEQVDERQVADFINNLVLNSGDNKVSIHKSERDDLGYTHTKFNILQNGIPVFNKMIIAHVRGGKLVSLNGDLGEFSAPINKFSIGEKAAFSNALKKVGAAKYKWQNAAEEQMMRETLNQPDFSYFPKAVKVLFEKEGKFYCAYQFNIYAEEPLYRANVFVDASTGKVLAEENLICTADVPAVAATKYSGTQNMTCDQSGAIYRLREVQRGLGVETYNLKNLTTYANNDFTNTTTSWTAVNVDQAARDAHWGAEKTYDYYLNVFNRNSINNAGYKLLSYVHYGNGYNNAFWDGTRMTYGDGNGAMFTIMTALDVCGHEITHGLVSNTGGLNGGGSGEPDALNEAFADIFGTSIERYSRPGNWNWKLGSELTPSGNGIRNMQNPKALQDPDTYTGQYWDAGGEPHNNAGPCIRWFYILVNGASGTNDLTNVYNVTGIGNVDAEKIAYRALTVYFVPGTNYAAARVACIQAAKDLFGNCSNQVTQTANAWYAVGVGPQFIPGVIAPNFVASGTSFCTLPANVNFNNTTANALSYTWDFGDGSVATSTNALHSYTSTGSFTVKLKATGCTGIDSIIKAAHIIINVPNSPVATNAAICENATALLTATANANIKWYTSPTTTVVSGAGNSFNTPALGLSTTYYVANTFTNSPTFGGRLTNANGSYLNNATQWLIFDVLQPGTLNSVVVYAQTAGVRIIELRNAGNTVLGTINATLAAGANTVTLNFNLVPGTGYQLGLNATSLSNLYRSNSGNTYPYNIGGCVSITGSSAGSGFYYWYYNWQVTKADCSSARVPVTVSVVPGPVVSVTGPSTFVCVDDQAITLSGSPAGGAFIGAGMAGSTFDPLTGAGNYNIAYSYTNNTGCSNSASYALVVDACAGISTSNYAAFSISVYPNPAKENVFIKSSGSLQGQAVVLYDAAGREILKQTLNSESAELNLRGVAAGMYFMQIKDQGNLTVRSVKLVKE